MSGVAVIGAGSWGLALAQVCAEKGPVTVLARRMAAAEAINAAHASPYLPEVALSPRISASADPATLSQADVVLCAAPLQATRAVLGACAPHLRAGATLTLCSKGVERGTLLLPTEVARAAAPGHPVAALSGPSFAGDVARGLPTAVTLAAETMAEARALQERIATRSFRPYPTDDLTGAQIGGALKNVLAIACGIVVARELGESARAALVARGFAEMIRLARAMGGSLETLAGLSGLGDLALTCASPQSRNFSLGLSLGAVSRAPEAVYEGRETAQAASALARRWGVETPVCDTVAAIVSGALGVDEAVAALLDRPLKPEE